MCFVSEKPKDNMSHLKFLEMENDRLIQELRLLQEQNILAQNRRKSDKEGKKNHYSLPHVPKVQKELHLHFDMLGNRSLCTNTENNNRVAKLPARMPDWDSRSYLSEPTRRPRTKVIMYKAFHEQDGNVKITRARSFVAEGNPRPAFIPPLNLKKLSSPRKHRYPSIPQYENSKHYQLHNHPVKPTIVEHNPARPAFSRKLSHVSEGHEHESKPPTGAAIHLPVIEDQGQHLGSRSVSPMKQVRSENNQVTGLAIPDTGRPESDVSLPIPDDNADQDSQRVTPVQLSPPADIAWQVNRTSPGPQKPLYSYGYEE